MNLDNSSIDEWHKSPNPPKIPRWKVSIPALKILKSTLPRWIVPRMERMVRSSIGGRETSLREEAEEREKKESQAPAVVGGF